MRKSDVLCLLDDKLTKMYRILNDENAPSRAKTRAADQKELLIDLRIAVEKMGTKEDKR